jgi:hypothetical protein
MMMRIEKLPKWNYPRVHVPGLILLLAMQCCPSFIWGTYLNQPNNARFDSQGEFDHPLLQQGEIGTPEPSFL